MWGQPQSLDAASAQACQLSEHPLSISCLWKHAPSRLSLLMAPRLCRQAAVLSLECQRCVLLHHFMQKTSTFTSQCECHCSLKSALRRKTVNTKPTMESPAVRDTRRDTTSGTMHSSPSNSSVRKAVRSTFGIAAAVSAAFVTGAAADFRCVLLETV